MPPENVPSFAGGDHQLTTDPTTGTCRRIPSDQSFSSDSLCKSAVAASIPYKLNPK